MARNVTVDRIMKFKGVNQRTPINSIGPNEALDCRNVIVNNAGFIEKLRLPTKIVTGPQGAPGPFASGPDSIAYYTKSSPKTRQYIANWGNSLYSVDAVTLVPTLIETSVNDSPTWNWVESNNILIGANGKRMVKWIGTALQLAGIVAPVTPPKLAADGGGFIGSISTVNRAANVVTAVFATPVDLGLNQPFIVAGVTDPSFNGRFTVATKTNQTHYTWAQVAGNAASGNGTYAADAQYTTLAITACSRAGGNMIFTLTASSGTLSAYGPDFVASARNLQVTVAGVGDATFNGTYTATAKAGNVITVAQGLLPDAASSGGTMATALTIIFGRAWAYSYKNSITGHESSRTPATGTRVPGNPASFFMSAVAPTDPQVDTIVWYATLDGGGDLFKEVETLISAGGLTLVDLIPDGSLDTTTVASLINNPPPVDTKYLAKWQGRIFGAGMLASPGDIWYSGYEQILVGRPEESVPSNNRLRLEVGADDIRAIGVIQAGVIGFSKSDKMYMLRGIIEDITVNAPVQFTAYLQELPWQIGAFSHYSCVSTEYGLAWFASDKTVRLYNGVGQPYQLSGNVWPILKSVTPGQESNARASYISWLDRQWYALLLAVGGSTVNNLIMMFDLMPNQEENAGVFIFDLGEVDSVASLEDANGQRILVIGQSGNILQIRTASIAVNGLSQGISSTIGTLYAFWRGGYHGNENAEVNKMYRWGRVICDQPTGSSAAFILTTRLVDNEDRPFVNPEIRGAVQPVGEKYVINRRAKRLSTEINFPLNDVDLNVLELEMAYIPTGIR